MKISKNVHESMIRLSIGAEIKPALLKKAMKDILPMKDNIIRTSLLSGLLNGLMAREPKKSEVVALIRAVFEYCNYEPFQAKVEFPGKKIVGVVGSGKKGHKTLNISSAASLLAASLGCKVIKPCAVSTSSITGSADFFAMCGVRNDHPMDEVVDILKEVGIYPLPMENAIRKFDYAYSGRFFAPHVLSFGLPPLLSRIKYDILLYGLAHPNIKLSAQVLSSFGVSNALIYSSTNDDVHFIDEMGIFGITRLVGIREGKVGQLRYIEPTEMLHLPRYTISDIGELNTRKENVGLMLAVLNGKVGKETALENIVAINATNILLAAGMVRTLEEGVLLVKSALQQGVAFEKLEELVRKTGGSPRKLGNYIKAVGL